MFEALFREALDGDADAGGLLAYNHLAGEPIAGLTEGRPLFVRTPDSRFTPRQLHARAALRRVRHARASACACSPSEGVELDRMFAHGGIFRTAGVAQRFLAGALDAPVAVGETASEGGAWGIAVLASYLSAADEVDLGTYLDERVFADAEFDTVDPVPDDVAGFSAYLDRYRAGPRRRGRRRRRALTQRSHDRTSHRTPHQTSHQTPHQGDAHDPHPPHHLARPVRGLVPHRQPAPLRRGDAAPGRRAVAGRSPSTLDAASDVPVKVVWKPVLTDSDAIKRVALEANAADNVIGLVAWMHTFSPAKMWIAGLDALQKPLAHLHTQANVELPWGEIDFDFMNLNQAAHGDREFGYIQTRLGVPRKTIVGHASDPRVQSRARHLAARGGRPRGIPEPEARPLRRQHALRRGHRGRQDRGRAALRRAGEHVGRERARRGGGTRHPTPRSTLLVAEYEDLYDVAPELRRGGDRHQSLRDGAAIELGLRSFLEEGGFGAFTTRFEDLGALRQLPGLAVQRLMAEGYGFGAEGDWKTAMLVRVANVMGAGLPGGAIAHGGLHLRPHARRRAHPRRAHARGLAVAHHARSRPSRCTRSASAARRTPCASSSPPTPARPWSSR